METKIKLKNGINNPVPKLSETGLRYQKTESDWGVVGFYQGYRLEFFVEPSKKLINFFKNSSKTKKPSVSLVNIYSLFSKNSREAWALATKLSKKRKSPEVCLEDIFLALLKSPSVKNLFSKMKVNTEAAETLLKNYLKLTAPLAGTEVKKVPFEAFALALKMHNHKIGSLMLLGALLKVAPQENILQAIFTNVQLNLIKLQILSAWILDLDYQFPGGSQEAKLLYCCRQAAGLEAHFGYIFEFPAIETAVKLSSRQTLKDLEHKKSLQLLVRAASLAKAKTTKRISKELVQQAAK